MTVTAGQNHVIILSIMKKPAVIYAVRILILTIVLRLIIHWNGSAEIDFFITLAGIALWLSAETGYSHGWFSRSPFSLIPLVLGQILTIILMIFWNPGFFSVFIVLFLFLLIFEAGLKKGLVFIAAESLLCITGFILFRDEPLSDILVLIPAVGAGFLIFMKVSQDKKDLQAEIDAQQTQIDGKNKLLSTLSHELRTPLSVIKTSTEILLEERPGSLNETQSRFLLSVLDNAMRMVRFVDTLLASIKIEYAWFRMKKRPMDVKQVIKKVCCDIQPLIESRGQELKYTYPNLLSRTIADENWIQQVLINLIHNASKHIEQGGRILISVTENEQCVVISVSDDGSGIVDQEKPKIFSEFYQSPETAADNVDGVGLGLSIVKNVIEKHDGNVYVGSVAGLGTTLSFTLPKEGDDS